MISIIVSTYKPVFFNLLRESIADTIGVDYEIIAIENNNNFSLCSAYNQGLKKSRFEYLCFVHEDVIFKSQNWGMEAVNLLKNNEDIGLIGVAGSKFKSSLPLGWQISILKEMRRGTIFQGQNSFEFVFDDFSPDHQKGQIEDVVILDGVILFSKKRVLQNCHFDETLLTGFHGYDTDFSLQVFFSGKRVIIDRGIKIFHYSLGHFGKEKAKAEWKISRKWLGRLPSSTRDLNFSLFKLFAMEFRIYKWFLSATLKRKFLKPVS